MAEPSAYITVPCGILIAVSCLMFGPVALICWAVVAGILCLLKDHYWL